MNRREIATRRLGKDRGQATIFVALFMGIVMLGFLAFAVDVGYFFHEKRIAQAAADAAAMAAAEEDGYGNTGNMQNAANAAAQMNGFDTTLATNPATVTLSTSTSGQYPSTSTTVPAKWVKAVVSKPVNTLFLSAFKPSLKTMTIGAMAIAGEGQTSQTCVCLEAGSGNGLSMSNGSYLDAPSCGVTVDSSGGTAIQLVGGATVNAQTLGTVSNSWNNSSNINNGGSVTGSTKVVQGISSTCNPSMPAAPSDTNCSADPLSQQSGGGVKYTVGPGSAYGLTVGGNTVCYTSLTVNGNSDTVTLNPGIYVINGGYLHFASGTSKGGNGVMFYLEGNASLTIDNGANVNLVAPTSGTYSGILLYQAASDTQAVSIQGGATSVITGSLYAPGAKMTLGNGSGTTITANIVAQSLTMSGGGTLEASGGTNLGSLTLLMPRLSQ